MLTERQKEILDAIDASGVKPDDIMLLLKAAAALTAVEKARAILMRKRDERDAAMADFETELQALQADLAAAEEKAKIDL